MSEHARLTYFTKVNPEAELRGWLKLETKFCMMFAAAFTTSKKSALSKENVWPTLSEVSKMGSSCTFSGTFFHS